MGDDRFWIRGEHYINLDPPVAVMNFPDRYPRNLYDRPSSPRPNRLHPKYAHHIPRQYL